MNITSQPDGLQAGAAAGAKTRPSFAVLSQLSILEFSGADSGSFLHGQLSCDVAALGVGQSTFGGYCTPRGRLLASFWLVRGPEAWFMLLPRDLAAATLQRLKMYVLRSKVSARDASDDYLLLGVAGSTGPEIDVIESDTAAHALCIRVPVGRSILAVPRERAQAVRDALSSAFAPDEAAFWERLDIQAGIPMLTGATRDQFVPQMLNLELIGGVSFTKGCYPGQEIVARSQYLGKVKRRMFLAHLDAGACGTGAGDAPPRAGDELFCDDLGDQAGGMVVSVQPSPEGGYDLLAVTMLTSRMESKVRLRSTSGPVLQFGHLPYDVS